MLEAGSDEKILALRSLVPRLRQRGPRGLLLHSLTAAFDYWVAPAPSIDWAFAPAKTQPASAARDLLLATGTI
jgi:hypothetical protein